MAYHRPPQGAPGYPPYQSPSPQPPYPPSHSPYQQPPPPSMNSPYPQGGYQQPYAPPPGPGYQQYPQAQQQGPYQQGPYNAPPPQGQWGPPPQQQGYQQQGYGSPPPQNQWGAPPVQAPPQQWGPPNPPSLGYVPGQVAPVDMTMQAEGLRKAMKGFGTNEAELIRILAPLDPLQVAQVRQTYDRRFMRNLLHDIEKETSGHFREGLMAIVRGPLEQDAHLLHKGIQGLGTKESFLNDVLLGRSNADINAIKAAYQHHHRRSLDADVRGDLSAKTQRHFEFVLAARRTEDSAPYNPQEIVHDVSELHRAIEGTRMGTDQVTVCQILSSRNDGQIRAIVQQYHQKYHRSLESVISRHFTGHMKDALLLQVGRAADPAKTDADQLEDAMKGLGTKDELLVNRVVRTHWDRSRMTNCKGAYKRFYNRELSQRIKGETSGDYQRLMINCVGGP